MEKNPVGRFLTNVILIGGSAGSIEVLMTVFPKLTELRLSAIVVVLHRKNGDDSLLEELIAMKTQIPVKEIEDKTRLEKGNVYIAPSDYHLLFEQDYTLSLDVSEKINYSRPSIDVSFESAADAYGKQAFGILLSGANADGAEGLAAIKAAGGKIAVQSPETAEVPFMPEQAIAKTSPEILRPDDIHRWIKNVDKMDATPI